MDTLDALKQRLGEVEAERGVVHMDEYQAVCNENKALTTTVTALVGALEPMLDMLREAYDGRMSEFYDYAYQTGNRTG